MQTILVADDQKTFREAICAKLRLSGFKTIEASTGLEALQLQETHQPDLILLDVDMPEMDGFETCRILSQTTDAPVLFLTGMTELRDQEKGFDLNAVGYITKPFDDRELMMHVRRWVGSNQSKSANSTEASELVIGTLRIALNSRTYVYSGNTQIALSGKEFNIIHKLASDPDKVWSPEDLSSQHSGTEVVRQHIKSIRGKFKAADCDDPIETIHARGYQLNTDK